jgi:hypothetical protein
MLALAKYVLYAHVRYFFCGQGFTPPLQINVNISISAARMCYARRVYIAVMAKQKAAGCCQLFLRYQLLMLHNLQPDDVRTEDSVNVFAQY